MRDNGGQSNWSVEREKNNSGMELFRRNIWRLNRPKWEAVVLMTIDNPPPKQLCITFIFDSWANHLFLPKSSMRVVSVDNNLSRIFSITINQAVDGQVVFAFYWYFMPALSAPLMTIICRLEHNIYALISEKKKWNGRMNYDCYFLLLICKICVVYDESVGVCVCWK